MSPKPLKRIKSEPPIDRSKARSSILRRGRSFKQESSVNFASTSDHFPNSVEHLESIPQRFSRDPSIKSNNDSNFDEIEDNKNTVLKHISMFKHNTNIYIFRVQFFCFGLLSGDNITHFCVENQEEVSDITRDDDVKENSKSTPTKNCSTETQQNRFPAVIIIHRITNGASQFQQENDVETIQHIIKDGNNFPDMHKYLPFIDAEQLSQTIETLTKSPTMSPDQR